MQADKKRQNINKMETENNNNNNNNTVPIYIIFLYKSYFCKNAHFPKFSLKFEATLNIILCLSLSIKISKTSLNKIIT